MFDIGWSEMAVILLVALVVIGPRDLPRVARTMGRWVAKGRSMAREFQTALEDMAREAELDKVKKEIEKAARTDFGKTVENTIDPTGELGKAFDPRATGKPGPTKQPASAKPATDQVRAGGPEMEASAAVEAKAAAPEPTAAKPVEARAGDGTPADAPPAERLPEAPAAAAGRARAKTPEALETVPAEPS